MGARKAEEELGHLNKKERKKVMKAQKKKDKEDKKAAKKKAKEDKKAAKLQAIQDKKDDKAAAALAKEHAKLRKNKKSELPPGIHVEALHGGGEDWYDCEVIRYHEEDDTY